MGLPGKTICLWYDRDGGAAARFHSETFPDSEGLAVHRAPGDSPDGRAGDLPTVRFTVTGLPCLGLNGGPTFRQTEAFSFLVATDNQAETDRSRTAIVGNGGQESECGSCRDRRGVNWQIVRRPLTGALAAGGDEAKRAFNAVMSFRRIDVAAIQAARREERRVGTPRTTDGAPVGARVTCGASGGSFRQVEGTERRRAGRIAASCQRAAEGIVGPPVVPRGDRNPWEASARA